MPGQPIGVSMKWGAALIVSCALWLVPSTVLFNAFYVYEKSGFTAGRWGSINIWFIVASVTWTACFAWLSRAEFKHFNCRPLIVILLITAIGLVFPIVGSLLLAVVPVPFASPVRAPLTLIVFFSEIPIAALLFIRCVENRHDEGNVLRMLKASGFSLTGLTVVKIAALVLLPGVNIRFTWLTIT